uniref:Putative secreted protein n=1 Tax=Ixodes ricinus TaxID=34613 RepID=V5H9V9_IXORI
MRATSTQPTSALAQALILMFTRVSNTSMASSSWGPLPEQKFQLGKKFHLSLDWWLVLPNAMSRELVLFWTFINSTVDYLQVAKTKENIWMNCTDDTYCDVAVMHGWTPEFKTGFITLKNLVPYTEYSVSLRGCNDAGCGKKSTLKVRTGMAAPGEPAGLTVLAKAESIEWTVRNQRGTLVTWKRPFCTGWTADELHCIMGMPQKRKTIQNCWEM